MNKKDFFLQLDNVRKILLQDWDPIGVGDEPMAKDEYDTYAFEVYRMLEDNKTSDDLLNYLLSVTQDRIGLTPNREQTQIAVENLLALTKE